MSDFSPSTERARRIYVNGRYGDDDYPGLGEAQDEFDDWLALVQAAAWDRGHEAGWNDRCNFSETTNPYAKGSGDE